MFHFYDPHNKFFYALPDSKNIFEKGLRCSWYDSSQERGDFKDFVLKFACSSGDLFNEFCKLSYNVTQVEWSVELQHGVFIIYASKNLLILDFNFKCFYSFASLEQLRNYTQNRIKNPNLYQNAFETRNQPFEVKFPHLASGGRNVTWQEGRLLLLGRVEIETVLCTYRLLPEQGTIYLESCLSLHSGKDLLKALPHSVDDIVRY